MSYGDICDGDTPPTKPTDAAPLAKWELKDEKGSCFSSIFCS
jgi:hypothetical protein